MAETFHSLLHGFSIALTPFNILWGIIGVTAPSSGSSRGRAGAYGGDAVPLTVKLDPTARSSCSLEFITAPCTAAQQRRFSSTRRANQRPSLRRSRATSWPRTVARPRPRHIRHRLFRRGDYRHCFGHNACTPGNRSCAEIWSGGVFCLNDFRLYHSLGRDRQLYGSRFEQSFSRAFPRNHWH